TSSSPSRSWTWSSSFSITHGATTRQPSSSRRPTTAVPSPPVPPVTIAVRSMAAVRPSLYLRLPMQVREFTDGCDVSQPLLVREVEIRARRDGGEYLRLTVGDRTGSVPAMVWDGVTEARSLCCPGAVVHASGRYTVHTRFG